MPSVDSRTATESPPSRPSENVTGARGLYSTHFELFGLAACFAIDPAGLETTYHRIQHEVHPDRHAGGSERDRRASLQWAVRVNEAYDTLRDPTRRARYLLSLEGCDPIVGEGANSLPTEFLMAQLAWREAMEEARVSRDTRALLVVKAGLNSEIRQHEDRLATLLDVEHNYADAAGSTRCLSFLVKVRADIDRLLDELDA